MTEEFGHEPTEEELDEQFPIQVGLDALKKKREEKMTAIDKLLADRDWYDDILGAWHYHGKPPLAESRAEYESLLARIKELEADNEAMRRVVEAAQKWKKDWFDEEDRIEASEGCPCEVCSLYNALQEYELSQ